MADEATETHDRDPFAPGSLGELVPDLWFDPEAWPDYEPEAPLSADEALERYLDWCGFWADFLEDTTLVDGRRVYTHERLRKARRSLSSLVSAGTLFTYLDPGLTKAGPLPSTNNRIEGGVNAQLRAVLRNHRGLTTLKRVKAVFWWCHAHSGDARTAREKLATMPRDSDIDLLYDVYSASRKHDDGRPEWGDRAVWEELHRKDPFPFWLD